MSTVKLVLPSFFYFPQIHLDAWQVFISRNSWWTLEVSISSPSSCRKWEKVFTGWWAMAAGKRKKWKLIFACVESLLESPYLLSPFIRSTFCDGLKRKITSLRFLLPHFPAFEKAVDHILLVICPYWSFVFPSELSLIFDYPQSNGDVTQHSTMKLSVITEDNVHRMSVMLYQIRARSWLLYNYDVPSPS